MHFENEFNYNSNVNRYNSNVNKYNIKQTTNWSMGDVNNVTYYTLYFSADWSLKYLACYIQPSSAGASVHAYMLLERGHATACIKCHSVPLPVESGLA
jgi:hypothetical protein